MHCPLPNLVHFSYSFSPFLFVFYTNGRQYEDAQYRIFSIVCSFSHSTHSHSNKNSVSICCFSLSIVTSSNQNAFINRSFSESVNFSGSPLIFRILKIFFLLHVGSVIGQENTSFAISTAHNSFSSHGVNNDSL